MQSIVGRVDLVATPSGITPSGAAGRRRLLAWPTAAHGHHYPAADPQEGGGGGGGGSGGKPKCPFEALMALGGFF